MRISTKQFMGSQTQTKCADIWQTSSSIVDCMSAAFEARSDIHWHCPDSRDRGQRRWKMLLLFSCFGSSALLHISELEWKDPFHFLYCPSEVFPVLHSPLNLLTLSPKLIQEQNQRDSISSLTSSILHQCLLNGAFEAIGIHSLSPEQRCSMPTVWR